MIVDAREMEQDAEIHGAIAIIGGGAAGITLAIELAQQFKDVLLLESGGVEFEPDTQSLYDGPLLGHDSTVLDMSRLRFLGGTTNHWAGQCAPFDAVDFERTADRPYSGWPFGLDALTPFYERAYRYCELGVYRSASGIPRQAESAARQMVESPELELTEFRYSPPTRFGSRYRSELRSSDKIKLYLHANVTDISVTDGGSSIPFIQAQTLTGKKFKVTAAAFILCCGGIENPRILLNCTGYFPNGIGNESDLVGRFFMDHLQAKAGTIVPQNDSTEFGPFAYRHDAATSVRMALKNSAETVRRHGRRACSVILDPEFDWSETALKARATPASRAFRELVRDAKLGQLPLSLGQKECAALDDMGAIAADVYFRMNEYFGNKPVLKAIAARLEGEQSPNPDSRVVLVDGVDALGMRKAGLDWRISAQDRDNLFQTAVALARGVGAAAFGRMVTFIEANDDQAFIQSTWHHMGTTRMHDDRRQGVVDRDCKVHGLANIFIAGSSVFPAGSRVNPTLTIVALAIRLADHLKLKVKNP